MIAFGCSIGETDPYRKYCEPGIRFAAEADSAIYPFAAVGPITRSYNLILDTAARREDLEALVLVHPHCQIVDPDFCAKVRQSLTDPDVAVVGCIGATGATSIAWWDGSIRTGSVSQRYGEHGGGEMPAYSWDQTAEPGEVDTIDGFLMVLSPWAVRHIRFDESMYLGPGYDFDYCQQVRAAGRQVMTADFQVVFHRSLEVVDELEIFVEAHMEVAEKWEGKIPGVDADERDWKERARRAEAEREAARAVAHSNALRSDARVLRLERKLEMTTETLSWRVTEPLRRFNAWRAGARKRLREGSNGRRPSG